MEYNIVEIEEFSIIGITIKTINKEGKSQKDIGELWGQFMAQNLISQIPNLKSSEIFCIYTDYETDFTGEYLTILGCKVNSLDKIPEGFIGRKIPKTKYRHYKAIGKIPDCVGDVWSQIWQSNINRSYIADFDVYGEKSKDPQNAEVDIYLSVI